MELGENAAKDYEPVVDGEVDNKEKAALRGAHERQLAEAPASAAAPQ
jgi:hypothetical protein